MEALGVIIELSVLGGLEGQGRGLSILLLDLTICLTVITLDKF